MCFKIPNRVPIQCNQQDIFILFSNPSLSQNLSAANSVLPYGIHTSSKIEVPYRSSDRPNLINWSWLKTSSASLAFVLAVAEIGGDELCEEFLIDMPRVCRYKLDNLLRIYLVMIFMCVVFWSVLLSLGCELFRIAWLSWLFCEPFRRYVFEKISLSGILLIFLSIIK